MRATGRFHHGLSSGIIISEGASPRIEDNEIWGNVADQVYVEGRGTSPLVAQNMIRDGRDDGIYITEKAHRRRS
jgi:nitrous oxidase accessory protein NosD